MARRRYRARRSSGGRHPAYGPRSPPCASPRPRWLTRRRQSARGGNPGIHNPLKEPSPSRFAEGMLVGGSVWVRPSGRAIRDGAWLGERRRVGRKCAMGFDFSFGRPCELRGFREHVSACVVVRLVLPLRFERGGGGDRWRWRTGSVARSVWMFTATSAWWRSARTAMFAPPVGYPARRRAWGCWRRVWCGLIGWRWR